MCTSYMSICKPMFLDYLMSRMRLNYFVINSNSMTPQYCCKRLAVMGLDCINETKDHNNKLSLCFLSVCVFFFFIFFFGQFSFTNFHTWVMKQEFSSIHQTKVNELKKEKKTKTKPKFWLLKQQRVNNVGISVTATTKTHRNISSFNNVFWPMHIVHFIEDGKFSYVQYSHDHFSVSSSFSLFVLNDSLIFLGVFLVVLCFVVQASGQADCLIKSVCLVKWDAYMFVLWVS